MPDYFQKIAPAPSENVKVPAVGSPAKTLLNQQGERGHALPHIGMSRRDPDASMARNRDHASNSRSAAPNSTADAPEGARSVARPTSITNTVSGN